MIGLDLGNLIVHLKADTRQYTMAMGAVAANMKSTGTRMKAMGTHMSLYITAPIAAIGIASIKSFADFDDAMTKSLSIMNDIIPTVRKEMEGLALSISKQGVTSAKELARSYFFLASAGLGAKQSMAALSTVNQFAIAGAFDMAQATDLLTDAQSALGLTVKDAVANMQNMSRVADVLVGANTLANASTQQFSLALTSGAGPAMKAFGIELEQGVAVLAAYADQGIKAQEAGNLLSRMLRLTTRGFMENRKVWKSFSVDIFDVEGELKDLGVIVGDLSKALGDLSTKQKIAALDMLGFQARSQQAILPLLGLGNRITDYQNKLEDMSGVSKNVAEKQMKSFTSQMKIFKNQIVSTAIGIGNTLAPSVLRLNEHLKNGLKWWSGVTRETKAWTIGLVALAAAIGPVTILLGALVQSAGLLLGVIAAIGAPILLLAGLAYTLRTAWKQNLFDIQGYWKNFYATISEVVGKSDNIFTNWITKMPGQFREVAKHMAGFAEANGQGLIFMTGSGTEGITKERWEKIAAAYMDGYNGFEDTVKGSMSDLKTAWNESADGLGTGISETFKELMDGLKNQVIIDAKDLMNVIKNQMMPDKVFDLSFRTDLEHGGATKNITKSMKQTITDTMITPVKEAVDGLKEFLRLLNTPSYQIRDPFLTSLGAFTGISQIINTPPRKHERRQPTLRQPTGGKANKELENRKQQHMEIITEQRKQTRLLQKVADQEPLR